MERSLEQRYTIKLCLRLGKNATETFQMLQKAFNDDCISRSQYGKWHKAFKEGREEVADEPRSGRPTTARTDENVDRVLEVLRTDRRLSIQQIANTLHMSTFVVHGIVTKDLQMRKVCAKLVPKVSTQDQKELGVLRCQELLDLIQNQPDFLNSVVTGDESWMFEYDPESKMQSCAWHTKSSSRPKKARMSKSRIKTMIIVFFDIRGIAHCKFVPQGQTVNSAFYLEVLRRLKRRIARVRTDIKDTVKLHHDNATSHTAFIITNFLARSNTSVIPHPPYSPDLAPCDFFLFPRLKRDMKGKHWETVGIWILVAEGNATVEDEFLGLPSPPANITAGIYRAGWIDPSNWTDTWVLNFTIGDGLCYGDMCNPPLQHGRSYRFGLETYSFFIPTQKSATDGHRLLCEAYGKHALSIKSCEYWFRRFKSGDFDTRDKERGGRPIKFEDAELEASLDEDSSQTQEELAETLGVTQQAISNRLKVMGMETSSAVFARANYCSKDKIGRVFLHRIVTGDEKWIHYDTPKRRKSSVKPGHASTSTAKPNIHGKKLMLCIWWDQLGVIYYELLQPNETITGERYQQQLMRLNRALKIKRPLYAKRHDKVIYQHDNARPHVAKVVKETLEALQWDVLPHPLYSPDIAPSDYHMFRSMTNGLAEQHFTSYEEAKNWVNVWIASKDEEFFRHGIRMLPERWEKVVAKDGQYFE
ncbi:hypothetical protein LAZ67_11001326 [Cordylochernes scorpioides]|uniref:HTH cro/C1-type domain-containing protein n=1 Tax=Cordylochernes scorpioides TaxID=51811 RepID=A0ABY6KYE0_9ARAC|nr:hypothetical protein LAZ67_11001326 [Cordylochernes scorpioides]